MRAALSDLNFEQAVFEIAVEADEDKLSENGFDRVTILIFHESGRAGQGTFAGGQRRRAFPHYAGAENRAGGPRTRSRL